MKHLILLIFLFILNFLNAGQNILKLLVKEKIEIYGTKLKILYKVSDKNDLVTLFYVDSINITLKINEIYCYYDFAKKEVITKEIYDCFGIVPDFISTYNSRKYAFPELVKPNDKGKHVLFGGYPKDCDKKEIIWKLVAKKEPQINWQYTRNNTLKKENFDQTDAYTCVLGKMKQDNIW